MGCDVDAMVCWQGEAAEHCATRDNVWVAETMVNRGGPMVDYVFDSLSLLLREFLSCARSKKCRH